MNDKEQTTNVGEPRARESARNSRRDIKLDVEVLEERIAPLRWLNRCEALVSDGEDPRDTSDEQRPADAHDTDLNVEVLEERIAPLIWANRCEALVSDRVWLR